MSQPSLRSVVLRRALRAMPLAFALSIALAVAADAPSPPEPPAPPSPPGTYTPQAASVVSPEQTRALAAAQAELERAAKRLADLHREYGIAAATQGGVWAHHTPIALDRPRIGVVLAPDQTRGVRIAGVTPDGAAAKAGIKSGDVLVRIGKKAIAGADAQARVDAAREILQSGDGKTPIALTYVRDGREREVAVTPTLGSRIMLFAGDGQVMHPDGNVVLRQLGDGAIDIQAGGIKLESLGGAPGPLTDGELKLFVYSNEDEAPVAPGAVERRVIRIECAGDDKTCEARARLHAREAGASIAPAREHKQVHIERIECKPGQDCAGTLRFAEAFRWSGLNLASVDAKLGRYFGATEGVLVLSAGPSFDALESGDVIRKVDGRNVRSPRELMDVLRGKDTGSEVAVDYLRDRKPATARVRVPEARLPAPLAPLPPIPPVPPAPPAPPLPPAPPSPPAASGV